MDFEFKSSDGREEIVKSKYYKVIFIGFLLLLANAGYLAAVSSSNLFYYSNLALHIFLGIALIIPLFTKVRYFVRTDMLIGKTFGETVGRIGYFLMKVAFISGLYLLIVGNLKTERNALYLHAFSGFIAAMCLISSIRRTAYNVSVENTYSQAGRWGLTVFVIAGMVPMLSVAIRSASQNQNDWIANDGVFTSSLSESEGQNEKSRFYPSRAETATGGVIATDFLEDSQSCGRAGCHFEIVQQFENSTHRRPAIANPWYRETYSYVQKYAGMTGGQFCAACHAQVSLFSGQAAKPIRELAKQPANHFSMSCMSCHAIKSVKSTLGNGAYVIERPVLSWLNTSQNSFLNKLHDFLIYADSDPHRGMLLKPFLREQSGDFCSSCHKMTFEKPILAGRAVSGLTEYDYWSGSVFDKQDIKAFGDISMQRSCTDCHMPKTPSTDPANSNGRVHDHSFQHPRMYVSDGVKASPGQDSLQTKSKLQVEIFAAYPVKRHSQKFKDDSLPEAYFAEAYYARLSHRLRPAMLFNEAGETRETAAIQAPLKNDKNVLRPGENIRLEVLVKSKGIGHAFPAGSPGAAEAWLEIIVKDNLGNKIYHSGAIDENGEIAEDTYFYGTRFVDEHGARVALAHGLGAKSASYYNLLPPQSADLSLHEFKLPVDCGSEIEITAKLQYRKYGFDSKNVISENASLANGMDATKSDTNATETFSSSLEAATNNKFFGAPVFTLSADQVKISMKQLAQHFEKTVSKVTNPCLSWNDYGIGLLRKNRLPEALDAFRRAVDLQPDFYGGMINIARVHLLAGRPDSAIAVLQDVMEPDAENPKAQYFLTLGLKGTGKLTEAKNNLRKLRKIYPEDRAILLELGHIYYLLESYKAANRIFRRVLSIAPDDPVAYFFLSHVYRRLEKPGRAADAEKQYEHFSRRINNHVVAPSLEMGKVFQSWQVLPWANYDKYTFSKEF
jgi:tetratricopeptide (TPR) repeat protein